MVSNKIPASTPFGELTKFEPSIRTFPYNSSLFDIFPTQVLVDTTHLFLAMPLLDRLFRVFKNQL